MKYKFKVFGRNVGRGQFNDHARVQSYCLFVLTYAQNLNTNSTAANSPGRGEHFVRVWGRAHGGFSPVKENKQLFINHCRAALPAPPRLLLEGGRAFAAPVVAFFMTCSCNQLSYCAFERICCPSPAAAELISVALITPPTAAYPPIFASSELFLLICC